LHDHQLARLPIVQKKEETAIKPSATKRRNQLSKRYYLQEHVWKDPSRRGRSIDRARLSERTRDDGEAHRRKHQQRALLLGSLEWLLRKLSRTKSCNNEMNAPTIHAVVEQAAESAKREFQRTVAKLEDVMEEKRQLERLEESLRAEMKQHQLTANLKRSGRFCWKGLNESNKWKKENVLAVFVSGRIPAEFTERLWCRTAPKSIRDDKQILLARLAAHKGLFRVPSIKSWELNDKPTLIAVVNRSPNVLDRDGTPEEFLDDEEIFRAYIRSTNFGTIAWAARLSKFSAGIRGNADLMLEAAKHGFLIRVCQELDESLRDDCCFATQLAETAIPGTSSLKLDGFSERVRANPEVVLAFVRRNGECLLKAAKSLRGNQEIVRAACTTSRDCSDLFLSAAGPVRQQLGRDRDFMMGIFAQLYNEFGRRDEQMKGDPRLFRMLSENLKIDRDVMVAANRCGSLSFSDISSSLSNDPSFWLDMIRRDSSFWYGLPDTFEEDPAYAHAIEDFESVLLVEDVFESFPALSLDRNVWFKIIASELKWDYGDDDYDDDHGVSQLRIVVRALLPEQLRLDRELLLRACKREGDVFLELDPTFGRDREFIEAVLENYDGLYPLLRAMTHNTQLLYPDLVIKAIAKDEFQHAINLVAPDLWSNFDVWKAWAESNAPFPSNYPDKWKGDHEFGLLVLKHYSSVHDTNDIMEAISETLRSKKSFMLKAVELNPEAFVCGCGGLQHDYDVVIAAFGNAHAPHLEDNLRHSDRWDEERPFLRCILNEAEQYLEAHDGFTKAFVHGMTAFAGESCRLSMLANDKHTSLALKQKIAAYAGVPVGKDLCIVRQAVRRLSALIPVDD